VMHRCRHALSMERGDEAGVMHRHRHSSSVEESVEESSLFAGDHPPMPCCSRLTRT
jgi:hypothetical protein